MANPFIAEGHYEVIRTVTAAVAVAILGIAWFWRPRSIMTAQPEGALNRAEDALANAVRLQLETQADERLLRQLISLPMRWGAMLMTIAKGVDAIEADLDNSVALRFDSSQTGEVEPGSAGFAELVRMCSEIGSGRLVLIGTPGAGKSATAIMLALELLACRAQFGEDRRRCPPVPVILSPSGWQPKGQLAEDWLAASLRALYPFLDSEYGPGTVVALMRKGRVTVMLDALDDLPKPLHPAALRAFNEQVPTMRLMMLARSPEAFGAPAEEVVLRIPGVELRPVLPETASMYLAGCRAEQSPASWRRLVEHLRTRPKSVLTRALDSPLMLGVVRDTLCRDEEINAILTPGRFANPREVKEQLLSRVVSCAYATEASRPPAPYTLEQAQRCLGYLALRMRRNHTRSLTWWEVPTWTSPIPRRIATALAAGFIFGVVHGFTGGILVGLESGLHSGIISGLKDAVSYMIFAGILIGLIGIVIFGIIASVPFARGGNEPEQVASLEWPILTARQTLFRVTVGFSLGLLAGLAGDVPSSEVPLATAWPLVDFAAWLVYGIAVGLVVVLLFSVSRPWTGPGGLVDPMASWRRAHRHGRMAGLAGGLVVGLAFAHFDGILAAVQTGLAFGLATRFVFPQTWPTGLAFLQLRRAGVVPARVMRFPEDARTRHLLQTAGPVYQFRHASIQDRLADWYADSECTNLGDLPPASTVAGE